MCNVCIKLDSTNIRAVVRIILLSQKGIFTLKEITQKCKKIGINDENLVYNVLDDLCSKDIIRPSGNGYIYPSAYSNDCMLCG